MTVDVVVGVDLGTTTTKALVVGLDGREVADARVATSWTERGPRVETTADRLFTGVLTALTNALAAAARELDAEVRGIAVGITGMAESGVLLGPDGASRSPVISWFDARGAEELRTLPADLQAAFPGVTGLPLTSLCTVSKLLWLRSQGITARPGWCWLNLPEYVAHRLGAERATEPSLASRTGLFDQDAHAPWAAALAAVGATADLLPPMLDAGTSLGTATSPDVPGALRGATIVVAGHDHPVASFGAGAWGPEDLFDSCGTAESVVRVVSSPLAAEQRARLVGLGLTAGSHVLADRWVVSGPTRGGLVLKRVLSLLGRSDSAGRDRLDRRWKPANALRGATVTGAAMTDDDVVVRTTGDGVDPDVVWAAALAHVATSVKSLARAIDGEVGPRRGIVAAGGWTRMSSVRAEKSRALPDVTFSDREQPGAYGAAILAAWAAAGRTGSAVDFATHFVPVEPTPDPSSLITAQGALT